MKKLKIILGFCIISIMILNLVRAEIISDFNVSINEINVDLTKDNNITFLEGTQVPIFVYFTAMKNLSEVRMKIFLSGFNEDIFETTPRFDIIAGTRYVKKFFLNIPSNNRNNQIPYLFIKIVSRDEFSEISPIQISIKPKDTTPPEAMIKFDPVMRDLVVIGKDDVDNNVLVNYAESCLTEKVKNCINKLRTYELEDNSNNNLILKTTYTSMKNYISIRILSLEYNNEDIKPNPNFFELFNSKGNIISQRLTLNNKKIFVIYNKNKDNSDIFLLRNNPLRMYKEKGLKNIVVQTEKGNLNYSLI